MTVTEASAPPRGTAGTLVAWWAVAGALFVAAPAPPPGPLASAEDEAIFQRQVEQTVAATRRWQDERGDFRLPWEQASGHLAIVIDGVGDELHLFDQLLALRFPLTFVVRPGAVYAAGVRLRARADRRRPRQVVDEAPEGLRLDADSGDAIAMALWAAADQARTAPTVVLTRPSQTVVEALRAEIPRLFQAGVAVFPLSEALERR